MIYDDLPFKHAEKMMCVTFIFQFWQLGGLDLVRAFAQKEIWEPNRACATCSFDLGALIF